MPVKADGGREDYGADKLTGVAALADGEDLALTLVDSGCSMG